MYRLRMTKPTSSPPAMAKLTVKDVTNEAVEARCAASLDVLVLSLNNEHIWFLAWGQQPTP